MTAYSGSPRGIYSLLGFLASMGIIYVMFFAQAVKGDPMTVVVATGIGAPAVGGFISRKAGRGAVVGFFSLFIPLFALGVYILTQLGGAAQSAEGLEIIPVIVVGYVAVALIALSFIAGILGSLFGAIGGWIGSKVFPAKPKFTTLTGLESYWVPQPGEPPRRY